MIFAVKPRPHRCGTWCFWYRQSCLGAATKKHQVPQYLNAAAQNRAVTIFAAPSRYPTRQKSRQPPKFIRYNSNNLCFISGTLKLWYSLTLKLSHPKRSSVFWRFLTIKPGESHIYRQNPSGCGGPFRTHPRHHRSRNHSVIYLSLTRPSLQSKPQRTLRS